MRQWSLQQSFLIFTLAGLVVSAASRGYVYAGTRGLTYLGLIAVAGCVAPVLLVLKWRDFSLFCKACSLAIFVFCAIIMPMFAERSLPSWQIKYYESAKLADSLLEQVELERFPGISAEFRDPMRNHYRGMPYVLIWGTLEREADYSLLVEEIEKLQIENESFRVAYSLKIVETDRDIDRTYWQRDKTKP